MTFPIPEEYTSEAPDIARDEEKRRRSPPSFFFAQSQALKLAAAYFKDERLKVGAHGGVAEKHRHRIQSALFSQVMAAFEFCLKDFVALAIDCSDVYDEEVDRLDWIVVDKSRVLAQREVSGRVGALLIHPTLGWHDSKLVNERYKRLFGQTLIPEGQGEVLDRLWILRHTVVHNAGFVTHHDAYRLRATMLSEKAARIDPVFLDASVAFLRDLARRLGDAIGDAVLSRWFKTRSTSQFENDAAAYEALKLLATVVESRAQPLPTVTEPMYDEDLARLAA